MTTRLSHLRESFASFKVDALLVTNDINIRYLTGFPASESWLLVTPKKAFYITDFRYVLEAQKSLKGVDLVQYTTSLFQTTLDVARSQKVKVLGVDERYISANAMRRLKTFAGKDVVFRVADSLVEALRSVKDYNELAIMRKAIKINAEGFRYIQRFIKSGVSEQGLLFKLEDFIRARKVAFAFPPCAVAHPQEHKACQKRKPLRITAYTSTS